METQETDPYWDNLGRPYNLKRIKKKKTVLFVEAYIQENLRLRWGGYIPIQVLTADFRAWALARGRMPTDAGTPTLGHVLRRVAPDLCRTYIEEYGEYVWVYQNVVLEPRWRKEEG